MTLGQADSDDGSRRSRIYDASRGGEPLLQGEVLSDVVHQVLDLDQLRAGSLVVNQTTYPYVIVASQSCDLVGDANARRSDGEPDKLLPNIFLCVAHTAEEVKGRKSRKGEVINNSTLWNAIKKNKDERYHFFEAAPANEDALEQGVPELIVDFKHYFSIATAELYWQLTERTPPAVRRTRLTVPYLEHFATRLFQFQARVATPRQHLSV